MKSASKILLLLLFSCSSAWGQNYISKWKKGNEQYENEAYHEAEVNFRSAAKAADEKRPATIFNLGDALYKQERYEEAAEEFSRAAAEADDQQLKADAYHNLGNALVKQQKLEEAVEAYKNSLRLDPQDEETRHNLANALRQQQQQQQQDQQQQDQDQQQDQKDQQQQEDQQDQQQGQEDQQQQDRQQGQEKPRPDQISREDAQRLLQALSKEEQEVQEKVNEEKMKGQPIRVEKDW